MCRDLPVRRTVVLGLLACAPLLRAQIPGAEWRRIGNTLLDLGLASPAGGPVERVWYSEDGTRFYARTRSGRVYLTSDFEQWRKPPEAADAPTPRVALVDSRPEASFKTRAVSGNSRVYGIGQAAYRSDDGGVTWSNLTNFRGASLLGPNLTDLAVSPNNPDEIAVSGETGVWRSLDGGLSWTGVNQLPNLPVQRIVALPAGARGLRILTGDAEFEWAPGEKTAWQPAGNSDVKAEDNLKTALAKLFGAPITAVGGSGAYLYAGSADGRLWASPDRGESWMGVPDRLNAAVESIFVSPRDGRIALAALGARNQANPSAKTAHVVRTMNGGIFWDDITANLPDAPARGITADPVSGAVYVASYAGVFMTFTDLASAGRATPWTALSGNLGPAIDVKLDAASNQLFVAMEGQGVYSTIAPHRARDVRVVNAADFSLRPAAPGGLLSVIGARVQSAQLGGAAVPVLDATDTASQIQVPFSASGSTVSLALEAATGRMNFGMSLLAASPAIFVDPDGSPLVMDAESGFLLDRSTPAKAHSRIQILATGLGRVQPDWPAGVAAPLSNPPRVPAPVRVFLDRSPLEVTQAILAPGYIGYYLVEAEIPSIVNEGPAELWIEIQGQSSNHVRLYLGQ